MSDYRTVGTTGVSDYWTVGLSGCRIIGMTRLRYGIRTQFNIFIVHFVMKF
jgi:hypothetical protein